MTLRPFLKSLKSYILTSVWNPNWIVEDSTTVKELSRVIAYLLKKFGEKSDLPFERHTLTAHWFAFVFGAFVFHIHRALVHDFQSLDQLRMMAKGIRSLFQDIGCLIEIIAYNVG